MPDKPRLTRSHAERRDDKSATRDRLVRAGLEAVLEAGWAASGVDKVLRSVGVPKGSFYYYFASKDEFGYALLESYQGFFLKRLERCFGAASEPDGAERPLSRQMADFLAESVDGMHRFEWRRGCLVGALGQELGGLHDGFRQRLEASLREWEQVLADAIRRAQSRGEIRLTQQPERLARGFWAAWEGAVLRARLARSPEALASAVEDFNHLIHS